MFRRNSGAPWKVVRNKRGREIYYSAVIVEYFISNSLSMGSKALF